MVKYVLCRRDIGPIGVKEYCAKDITFHNGLDWCADCLKRMPIWPTGDIDEQAQIKEGVI